MTEAALSGFMVSFGLILAIGAQNAFVLRQGIRGEHVLPVVLFCAASDAILIALGVSGLSILTEMAPWLQDALKWGGAAFLLWYGARAFRSALCGGQALKAADAGQGRALAATLATIALLTWANPHVWLDTVVLVGSVASQYPGRRLAFGAGAATASFVFFTALGFGARLLAPLFARPRAWQVLDALVGVVMWTVAAGLLTS